ncbi:MAG: amino acid ABC transporter substrate-binding protein [Verrucomicrobiae bacterium]|nr:amino acid ABC transporter substrate-binding protein [Verrucomicrobiae bacterium]
MSGLLARINSNSELHAGYGVYPPYTQEDPNTKAVSGFSVDLIEQIAKESKCKVVWHRLNWNTMSANLKRGEFDVIADPIFQTIPRAREFAFTAPYAYFADGIAVVRKDDSRFTDFASLDRAGITIAVGQGWASETLVKTRFTNPKIVSVQTATDLLQVFNEVVAGRADVAIADGASAQRFVNEHADTVKALWLDNPPAAMPAGFALRPDDARSAEFLTVCLRNLESTGILDALARKWQVPSAKARK